jgi:hypothetical protein
VPGSKSRDLTASQARISQHDHQEDAVGDRLAGKVCIVTGAGSGIGRASAIRFVEEGARPRPSTST